MSEEVLSKKAREALRHIRNWLAQQGTIPSMRELMAVMEYRSPRSAMLLIEELVVNGFLEKKSDGGLKLIKDLQEHDHVQTVAIPLVGIVTCGTPILAEENINAYIPVSTALVRPGRKYFLLKARGNSMDQAGINDGDLLLVKQEYQAKNGEQVVALIDDEATVKEFHNKGDYVALLPRSSDARHQPIILTKEFRIQGVVVAIIPEITF